jgi:uncharacterized hydrophobic protein (TIGR00271 family)
MMNRDTFRLTYVSWCICLNHYRDTHMPLLIAACPFHAIEYNKRVANMTTNVSPPKLSLRGRIRYIWRKLVKPIGRERRAEVRVQLREDCYPDFDYFLFVVLSCVIATLGLLIDSPATIIGAMLVAPLMSPIIGIGLASITGDGRLLSNAVISLALGALLAILIAFLITVINRYLPFIVLEELPDAVLSRTQPSPFDLGIALAGGLAAAFALAQPQLSAALPGVAIATALMPPLCTAGIGLAMGRLDVAGGSFLLFITNSVTIAFASMLVFFALGFGLRKTTGSSRVPRSLIISASLTVILIIPLSYLSYQFVQRATENREIETVIDEEVSNIHDAELVEWRSTTDGETLNLDLTIRTIVPFSYEDSVALQSAIADQLQRPVSLVVNQIFAARLDPLVPPTHTATPTVTRTITPGPSLTPTATRTPMPTITSTSTNTPTTTATSTSTQTPTSTPTRTSTPTPALAQVVGHSILAVNCSPMRQTPDGPVIGFLSPGDPLIVLYGYEILDGIAWIEVLDEDGRLGWIPQTCTFQITLTPTRTPTETSTYTPTSIPATPTP